MKENLKRLMAIILTVCLLSTLFVPAAFADGSTDGGAAVSETYNFNMKTSTDPEVSKYKWDNESKKINKTVVLADGTDDTTYDNYTKLI